MSSDERLNRNRERNRIHARKTRERKKFQTTAIQQRIHQLYQEGIRLRQMIDERYTASSLLGLSRSPSSNIENDKSVHLIPSSNICNNFYEKVLSENNWIKDTNGNPYLQQPAAAKRVRRSGKLNPQEREKIRRERNRMHAKKTRDRKKYFLEMSDKIITEMETEAQALRAYLRQIGLLSQEECDRYALEELKAKQEIDNLKMDASDDGESDNEEDEDDESGPEGEERVVERCSDENEKVSSWSRSSASSNHNSSLEQSRDFNSAKSHSSSNADTAKLSGSTCTSNDKSSNYSSDSFQEKRSADNSSGSEERDSPDYNNANMNDNEWNEGDEYRGRDDRSSDQSSEVPESYHHGLKRKIVRVVSAPNLSNRNGINLNINDDSTNVRK